VWCLRRFREYKQSMMLIGVNLLIEYRVLRNGIKIAYSDWYLDYCELNENKTDEEASLVCYMSPPENTLDFYASEEVQKALLDKCNSANKQFFTLKRTL
jgi:hypothetical protein